MRQLACQRVKVVSIEDVVSIEVFQCSVVKYSGNKRTCLNRRNCRNGSCLNRSSTVPPSESRGWCRPTIMTASAATSSACERTAKRWITANHHGNTTNDSAAATPSEIRSCDRDTIEGITPAPAPAATNNNNSRSSSTITHSNNGNSTNDSAAATPKRDQQLRMGEVYAIT